MEGSFVYGDNVYIDDSYMDEEWEYIYGIEGYMISNKARVWSERSQKFLKLKKMDKHGHLGVCLYLNGKRIYKYIHRLVAEAFIQSQNEASRRLNIPQANIHKVLRGQRRYAGEYTFKEGKL